MGAPPILLSTQVPLGAIPQYGGTPPPPGVPVAIGPPNTLQIPLANGAGLPSTATLDLTTLTGALLELVDPLGNAQTLTGSIFTATAGTASVSYALQGTEFGPCGTYRLRVFGKTAGGGLVPFGPPSAFPVVAY